MIPSDALEVFAVGVCFGLAAGVPLGRWLLLLVIRRVWVQQQRRQRVHLGRGRQVTRPYPRVEIEHAGEYVQHLRSEGRRAGWSQLEPPGQFARVRG